jgi:hypothetical protein
VGTAVLSALVASQRAQHFADKSSLLDVTSPHHIPWIAQKVRHGPGGLIPLWVDVQNRALTDAYSDVFFVLGTVTLCAVPLVLAGRWAAPRATEETSHDLVAVGS